jgi:hypothetical protein
MSSKTIQQWCDSHGFSRGFFYILKRQNKAPRTFNAGAAVRISDEADTEWVRAREVGQDRGYRCEYGMMTPAAWSNGRDADHSVATVATVAREQPEQPGHKAGERRDQDAGGHRADGPLPLFPTIPKGRPYPIDALGGVLSSAALAIARKVQVPPEIAAQSVLAAASLGAQAYVDVRLPFGQTRPCSLYFGTIAASGDRKTTADNEALRPIRLREKALKETYKRERQEYAIAHCAWTGEKKKIEGDKKLDFDSRKVALTELGCEPACPLSPFLTAPDPTVEGLTKAWVTAPPALGLFTTEGGQFVGGFGMTQEHRLKTAAAFSDMWDGEPIRRIRAGDGVVMLEGRRLTMHLMVQPEAAARFFADPTLRDQGLLSRVLVAAPETIAGTRTYEPAALEDERAIEEYSNRILILLERPWPLAEGTLNELTPRVLTMTSKAEPEWRNLYDEIERRSAPDADLHPIRDFAAKAAEHAARMAAVITTVENPSAADIDAQAMNAAVTLLRWYVGEAIRLQAGLRIDPRLLRANQLLEWFHKRTKDHIEFRDILRLGPAAVRTKTAADDALAILAVHGWVKKISSRPHRLRIVTPANH